MAEIIAIRHVAFEDLGSFEDVLERRGFTVTYLDAARDPIARRVRDRDPELLVVLGGPVGAYEDDLYPVLGVEKTLIRERVSSGRPVLGICLGAQLIAAALGSRVYPGPVKEIGWAPVTLSAAGAGSPLAELTGPMLHWHGDTFDLPAGATHLASTPDCRNQAFAIGAHVLGLQFHPEVRGEAIESWLIGHAAEIGSSPGVSVENLRADTSRYAPALGDRSQRFLDQWLDSWPSGSGSPADLRLASG